MKHSIIRRLCAVLLVLALCFGMAGQALAYTGVSAWAKEEVDEAGKLGLIPSAMDKENMSGAMSRLNMCRMAVNTFETLTETELFPGKISYFMDTRDADVCVAYELGLVNGYPDGTFRPNQQITRQEFSKIIHKLISVLGWSEEAQILSVFKDDVQVASWAQKATAHMATIGIITGGTDGRLKPNDSTSVEQACVMFLRIVQLLAIGNDSGILGAADPVGGTYTPSYTGVSDWAKDAVKQMDLYGLLPASLSHAAMNMPITRAQMCEMAVVSYAAITGKALPTDLTKFTDTTLAAAEQARALGIISGFPDGSFHPDEALTRQQFFQISDKLMTACGYREETDAELLARTYIDAAKISDWAQAPVALLYRMSVMQGDSNGRMNPADGTTCEQAVALLLRAYQQVSNWYQAHPLAKIEGPLTQPNLALQVVEMAKGYVGYPYIWAGASPTVGFDCSGLVYYVYRQFGFNIERTGDGMVKNGIEVKESEMQPGDIIIFASRSTGSVQHVGLYIGDGLMVHAQSSKTGVVISRYDYDATKYIYSIRRVIY